MACPAVQAHEGKALDGAEAPLPGLPRSYAPHARPDARLGLQTQARLLADAE